MISYAETLWVLTLYSKFLAYTETTFYLASLLVLAHIVLNLLFWLHPGGPAWGKHTYTRSRNGKPKDKPIPGPKGFPIIGSLNLMVGLAHHKIAAMALACGAKRLMALSLGETRLIVTCNPDVAKEILNSSEFADRPVKESAYLLMFNRAIGFAPYGVYWRTLRRIAATHLFSPKQMKASESQRSEIAKQMVETFCSRADGCIRVRDVIKRASLNSMMGCVFGREYRLDSFNAEAEEVKSLVDQGYELLGVVNWSDHLPWLADFDLQGVRFSCSQLVPKVNRFVSRIIDQHRAEHSEINRDFVDVLLNLQETHELSNQDTIAVLWEMIFRGTDTVAVLIEWILARMVLHPHVQSRVQDELDRVVGRSRSVNETDIPKMSYLAAVIKEVLRLHPPGPLLSWARLAITDTTVDGYRVPKGTTAMVNMWAITRDPEVWADPLDFKPERFMGQLDGAQAEFSVLGADQRLAPFGSGRRTCPGKILGLTTVTFWVAALLHEFEFRPAGNVDLSERLRLSCEMAHPLTVRLRPNRLSPHRHGE